jgi:type VI secretion system protein ImpH
MREGLNLLNDLDTDFKATVKVAEMLENGDYQSDQIAILPVGAKESGYAKDIKGFSSYYSENKLKDCLIVQVNREGLYDMLPEGLFHTPPVRTATYSEGQMVDDVQVKSAEEREARKFFMPFEAELNHMRIVMEWYENRLDKKSAYNDLSMLFGVQWKEFDFLDKEQRIVWMHLLPLIQQKRNDMLFMGQLLSVLFNMPVEVACHPFAAVRVSVHEDMQFKIGGGALGIDTVIGQGFETDVEEIEIKIGPVEASKLITFLPGTPHSRLLSLVLSYLVPVETSVKIALLSEQESRMGMLGDDTDHAFLGYTAYL